jgi:MFS family permease
VACLAIVAACMNGSGIRSLTALYVAAPFSMGYVDFYTFLMPLYALSLGFDAAEVGILVGARSIVATFLSIHIGVLTDRFGTRKVTLFFVWTSMILAPLFPLGAMALDLAGIAIGQRRRGVVHLGRGSNTDCAAGQAAVALSFRDGSKGIRAVLATTSLPSLSTGEWGVRLVAPGQSNSRRACPGAA